MTDRHTDAVGPHDAEIAAAVMDALRRDADVRGDGITVTAVDGWVTLRGRAEHLVQRSMADCTVRYVPGVKGVTNLLTLAEREPEVRQRRRESWPVGRP